MRYRKLSTAFWNDAKVRELSDDGKLALLFVLTHPNMTSIGAMRANPAGLASELGWTPERFTKAFREALAKGLLEASTEASLIALPKFMKHNKPESPNVVKSWAHIIPELPECPLKDKHLQRVKAFTEGLGKAFAEALPEPFAKALPNQEQEQEHKQEQEQEQEPELLKRSNNNNKDKRGESERGGDPAAVGEIAGNLVCCFQPNSEQGKPDDELGHWKAAITDATRGEFHWNGAHVRRLEAVLQNPRGEALLHERIIEPLTNSEAASIRDPGGFANTRLCETAEELGVGV